MSSIKVLCWLVNDVSGSTHKLRREGGRGRGRWGEREGGAGGGRERKEGEGGRSRGKKRKGGAGKGIRREEQGEEEGGGGRSREEGHGRRGKGGTGEGGARKGRGREEQGKEEQGKEGERGGGEGEGEASLRRGRMERREGNARRTVYIPGFHSLRRRALGSCCGGHQRGWELLASLKPPPTSQNLEISSKAPDPSPCKWAISLQLAI